MVRASQPVAFPSALIVEPDPDTSELYTAILRDSVGLIAHAKDGREALVQAIGGRPAIVITDMRLPYIDGVTLCSLLRSDPITADATIVIMTADSNVDSVKAASAADSVLLKPCAPENLLEAIVSGRRPPSSQPDAGSGSGARTKPGGGHSAASWLPGPHRFETTMPALLPPALRCPTCCRSLVYVKSYVGGAGKFHREQWDVFTCPAGCGTFEYRQRTRSLRAVM
jgi:CheY-like chemotaxis protein